jgi:hypothetical protein
MVKISDKQQITAIDASIFAPVVVHSGGNWFDRRAGMHIFQTLPTGHVSSGMIADVTREILHPCHVGYNITDSTDIIRGEKGIEFPDSKKCRASVQFYLPRTFSTGMSVRPLWIAGATGLAFMYTRISFGATGESWDNTQDITAYDQAPSVAADELTDGGENFSTALGGETIGDFVTCYVERDAAHASDTLSASIFFVGFLSLWVDQR